MSIVILAGSMANLGYIFSDPNEIFFCILEKQLNLKKTKWAKYILWNRCKGNMLHEGHEEVTNFWGNIYLPLGQSSLRKTPK